MHRPALAAAFAAAARCYWVSVFPQVQLELRHWRRRAAQIPDPELRSLALHTHETKWDNVEGAAAFATLVPAAYRSAAIQMLVAFQASYDYADTLAEQPRNDPVANGRLLHQPLLIALDETAKHPDYYAHYGLGDDDGYLTDLTDTCRHGFHLLPSHALVARTAKRAAERIVTYQSLNHSGSNTHDALSRWAESETPPGTGLRWWETGAACASSLTTLALLSAAADPKLTAPDVTAIESAYHPWIGALHTLLDSLVDWLEDEQARQPSLLDRYNSTHELADRVRRITQRSREVSETLPRARRHIVVLAGMTGLYLSAPKAYTQRTRQVRYGVLDAIGDLAQPTILVMTARRNVRRTLRN